MGVATGCSDYRKDDKGRITKAIDKDGNELVYTGMSKMSKSKTTVSILR